MDYSQNLLEEIRVLASKLTPITEIGVLLDIPINELRDDIATEGSPAWSAFHKGLAQTAKEMREMDMELAKAGSPAAAEALRTHLKRIMNDL